MKKTLKLPNKENKNLTLKDGCIKYVPTTATEIFAEYEGKVRKLLNNNKNVIFSGGIVYPCKDCEKKTNKLRSCKSS